MKKASIYIDCVHCINGEVSSDTGKTRPCPQCEGKGFKKVGFIDARHLDTQLSQILKLLKKD